MTHFVHESRTARIGALIVTACIATAGCGAASTGPSADAPASSRSAPGNSIVLPVTDNPISNNSSVQALKIDSVLVENNLDAATGKAASDHLEIALANTGSTELSHFEVFYTFSDQTSGVSESYYAKLSDGFTIPAGGKRVVHFDDSGSADHYPVNKYSLYYTSKAALDVHVMVSAAGAAVQQTTLKKDAGGAENPDE